MKLPRHDFWGAGEADCPKDLKAPNGELHTMRCKVCGDGWRESVDVCFGAMWRTVQSDGYPPCDSYTTYIGINSNGYACCFNAIRGGVCVMVTAEGAYRQMSDLRDWRLLDRPARGVASSGSTPGVNTVDGGQQP